MEQKNKRINMVTLGCSKNLVDSEYLMKQLDINGWEVLIDSNDPTAEVVIINTCGFIADAKEESIDTILNFVEAKRKGLISRVFVMGCLSQRYKSDLEKEIPDVDEYFGVDQLPDILQALNTSYSLAFANSRLISTPKHYAFLKISEGCSWGCSFCAIPIIRGKHISKPMPELIEQAKSLADEGVKELIVIAQDSTFYGKDIYGERKLPELLESLSRIDKLEWIRIHYAYPTGFPFELLRVIQNNPKICKYIDIPLQHISDRMLKAMHRGITKTQTIDLVERIRREVPGMAIRTTLLVGHPGETEEDFMELLEFVKKYKFERLGVFTYSHEEGTPSASLNDTIPQEEKERRAEAIMEIQRNISLNYNFSRVNKIFKVIVDRSEGDFFVGRTEFDSPEVDGEVLIKKTSANNLEPGLFVNCKIISAEDYDLIGEVVE